jgi:hypothetical protein
VRRPLLPTVSYWTVAVLLRKLNSEVRGTAEGRKDTKLIEKTVERTDADDMPAPQDEPSIVDMPISRLVPGSDTDATNARRERRARRGSSTAEPLDFNAKRERRARRASPAAEPLDADPAAPDVANPGSVSTGIEAHQTDREAGQASNGERRRGLRAVRAEQRAAADAASAVDGAASAGALAQLPDASAATAETLSVELSDKKSSRSTRALARAERTQQDAAAALHDAGEHPALGALNRHLNMLTQQLETAHRVVGRVAAERDALRQQLADLEGIPVEQIVVTSVATATDDRPARTREHGHGEHRAAKLREHGEPVDAAPNAMARLNYFRHEDIAVMRRRRQVAALCLLGVVLVLWTLSKMGYLQTPENVGKDSLSQLPVVGELMSYMLAGWVLYRIVKMGGKGVKWIFPSEPKHKRR